jgi:ADP-ribose pyrophosphatase YjhB (NUDIX family)
MCIFMIRCPKKSPLFLPTTDVLAPLELYEQSRKFFPMLCVDCVVLVIDSNTQQLRVCLLRRNSQAVAPDTWWFVGGRMSVAETMSQTCVRKLYSELGVHVVESTLTLLGFGTQRFVASHNKSYYVSAKPYPITTTTFVYCVVLSDTTSFIADDGNTEYRLFAWDEFISLDLHPYIFACVKESVAIHAPFIDTSLLSAVSCEIFTRIDVR